MLEQQVKEAEERLRREVALAAVNLAEQMVKKSLGPADQQRLVDTFVTDVVVPAIAAGAAEGGLMAAIGGGSVARRYARALFGIGVDGGTFEALGQEIGDLATLWTSSAELRHGAGEPGVSSVGEAGRAGADPAARGAHRRGAAAGAAAAGAPPHPAAAGHRPRLPRPGRRAHRAGPGQGHLGRAARAGRARSGAPRRWSSAPARR